MADVGVVVWNDICFVLSWAGHVEVLRHERSDLLSKVELWRLVETVVELVSSWTGHLDSLNHVLSPGLSNGSDVRVQMMALAETGVVRSVRAWTNARQRLRLSSMVCVVDDSKACNRLFHHLVVGVGSRNVFVDPVWNNSFSENGLGLMMLVSHVKLVDVIRAWTRSISSLTSQFGFAFVRSSWNTVSVARLSELDGSVLSRRRNVFTSVVVVSS